MIDKKIAVCYATIKDGPIILYRACSSVEEAAKIIASESFKALKKAEVFVGEVIEEEEYQI